MAAVVYCLTACGDVSVDECSVLCGAANHCFVGTCGMDGYCHSDANLDHCTSQLGVVPGGPYNYAFVTSTTIEPRTLGGTTAADAACTQLARTAGVPGTTFLAWLSTSSIDATSRIRMTGARGWIRRDGRPFADSVDSLIAGQVLTSLRIDENGDDRQVVEQGQVIAATGTHANGASGATCGDWSSGSSTFTYGDVAASTNDWTDAFTRACTSDAHLYCLGVDLHTPLAAMSTPGRIAFVTTESFVPAMGIEAADALCQSEARSDQLPAGDTAGSYRALLSTAQHAAASRMDLTGSRWVRVDGVPWVARASDVAGLALLAPLNVTADGQYQGYGAVFTGSETPNVGASGGVQSCADWTSSAGGATAISGIMDYSNDRAFDAATTDCAMGAAIYCLQQ